ncbi:MAG: stage III sporulation protein AF [Acetatifactor sp.]|nr:stage III sporulation protein AF [Acetatifactor sp.]
MVNSLFQAICRTGIFMICAQAIVHFRPQESYEKYLKLLVSVMVLVQLFFPLGSFLAGVGGEDVRGQLENFRESLEQSMEEARQQAEETDALLEQMTLEEVRRRMEEQIADVQTQDEQDVNLQTIIREDEQNNELTGGQISIDMQDITVEVGPIEQIFGE